MGFPKNKNILNFKRAKVVSPLDELNEALDRLAEKEKHFKEKASQEVVKAKEFTRANNETAAIQCLKRKKLYEEQIEQLGSVQLRIEEQMIMFEGGEAAAWALDALKIGAEAMKAMCVRNVDNVIYDIDEHNESMKQMLEAVSTPSGAAALFDEDELKEELAELERAE